MAVTEKIRKLLEVRPNIKPKEASEVLKIPYSQSFRNLFYKAKHTPITANPSTVEASYSSTSPPLPTNYKDVNIKRLITDTCIEALIKKDPRLAPKSLDILTREEFITQSEIKHGVYWDSEIKPYHRPDWLYPWQEVGIELMRNGHCMWQASRQKPGKTTAAGIADFEDMLQKAGTVVSVFAPTVPVGKTLMRQMFHETITLEDGTKYDLWNQLFRPYFIVNNVLEKVMKNGSRIQVITLDYKAVQGLASDVIHIEELDKAVREPQKLEAIAALFPQIRARKGQAKIRITCNNASGVYRIFRDELRRFGIYFPIYMEKPNLESKFTGEHYIYNDNIVPEEEPDVDEILKVIMFAIMGEGYVQQQLYNVDDYTGDLWNPDKLEIAYKKKIPTKRRYEHTAMGIDPGAVHAFAVTIYAKEGLELYHLWTKRFSLSDNPKETAEMLTEIAQTCANMYVKYDCEFVASESNSGARLIIPHIGKYVKQYVEGLQGESFARWREIWSNFGADSENQPGTRSIPKSDFIALLTNIIDFEHIILQDRNNDEHIMRMEFARYDPSQTKEKYKGDCVDSTMHVAWWLCGGKKYIDELMKIGMKKKVYAL